MILGGIAYLFPIALKEENKKWIERGGGIALIIASYALISKKTYGLVILLWFQL